MGSVKAQFLEIKEAIAQEGSVITEVELDDVNNLCFKMSAKGKSTTKTLVVPEDYPRGDFMLFEENGDVKELGRGTLKDIVNKVIQDFAKKHGVAAIPSFGTSAAAAQETKQENSLKQSRHRPLRESHATDDGDDFDQDMGDFDEFSPDLETGKKKIMEYVEQARKAFGKNLVGVFSDLTQDYVVRIGIPVNFLQEKLAVIWGINYRKNIIVEFEISAPYYMDGHQPPNVSLYQSGDNSLDGKQLADVQSFGLHWQLKKRLDEYLKGHWPPTDTQFMVNIVTFLVNRINTCTKTCIICDQKVAFEMLKPSICDNPLCLYSYEQYGLGVDVVSEIRASPEVVDLLISITCAACQNDQRRFNPYPQAVEVKQRDTATGTVKTLGFMNGDQKNTGFLQQVINMLPTVNELRNIPDSQKMKETLDTIHGLAFPLFRWILTTNRAHLAKLDEKDHIKEMGTKYQYLLLSSPPEKESAFRELKKKYGAFWAFHGSSFGNWHSILRVGLKNYSNTALMSTGAAYGPGIYMAPDSSTSLGYAHQQCGWPKSMLNEGSSNSYMQCLALCEVIDYSENGTKKYKANPYYVVPSEDHVCTRYFFIYNGKTSPRSVMAADLKIQPFVF